VKEKISATFALTIAGLFLLATTYVNVAWIVFRWNNPLCNDSAFRRHFVSVMAFKRFPQYQPVSDSGGSK
jgi:hypothetical protein